MMGNVKSIFSLLCVSREIVAPSVETAYINAVTVVVNVVAVPLASTGFVDMTHVP